MLRINYVTQNVNNIFVKCFGKSYSSYFVLNFIMKVSTCFVDNNCNKSIMVEPF